MVHPPIAIWDTVVTTKTCGTHSRTGNYDDDENLNIIVSNSMIDLK